MSGLVGAEELGLCALAGRLDEAAARLAVHQRALVAASGTGAEVQLALRTVTTVAAWSTEQAADVRRRLQALALYRAGWLPAWAASADEAAPPSSPLEPISGDLGTLVTLLKVLLPGLEDGLNAIIRNPAARAAVEHVLSGTHTALGRVSVVIDVAYLLDPPHDGWRGASDRAVAAAGIAAALLLGPEIAPFVAAGATAYWIATFVYDERAAIAEVAEAVWDGIGGASRWSEGLLDDMAGAAADVFDDLDDALGKVQDLWSSLKGAGCDGLRIPILSAAIPPVFRPAAWDLCPRLR